MPDPIYADPITSAAIPPGTFKLYRSPEGAWLGVACVQTAAGPVYVCAKAHERTAMALIAQRMAAAKRGGAAAGGIFGDIFKKVSKLVTAPVRTIGKVASKIAKGDVLGALRSGVRGALQASPTSLIPGATRFQEGIIRRAAPLVAKLAPLATFIPGIGPVAAPMLGAGARLLARAYRGDPRARQNITALRQAAPQNPGAQSVALLLARLHRAEQGLARMRAARGQRGGGGGLLASLLGGGGGGGGLGSLLGAFAGESPHGTWTTASNGEHVFVPNAYAATAGGPLWDTLRPRLGYRSEAGVPLTTRRAYREGINTLATMR